MRKLSASIPTIIKNLEVIEKKKTKKKKDELQQSVVVFQHNNLVEARYSLTLQEKKDNTLVNLANTT